MIFERRLTYALAGFTIKCSSAIAQAKPMTQETQAIYSGGVLRPLRPLALEENELVAITVHSANDDAGSAAGSHVSRNWLPLAERQLDAIKKLGAGWDSYGAEAPDSQIIESASRLMRKICQILLVPKPHINPTPSGGVQFEWESGGKYFEIDLVSSASAEYLYEDSQLHEQVEGVFQAAQLPVEIAEYLKQFAPAT
jgi:predicted DNA-binding antitoxin AbrB/MazE fold protein